MKKEKLIRGAKFAGIAMLPLGLVALAAYGIRHLVNGRRNGNQRLVGISLAEAEACADPGNLEPEVTARLQALEFARRGGEALDA